MTFAATTYVLRALNTPKMHLQLELSCKRNFGVFRAWRMCLQAANVVLPHWQCRCTNVQTHL